MRKYSVGFGGSADFNFAKLDISNGGRSADAGGRGDFAAVAKLFIPRIARAGRTRFRCKPAKGVCGVGVRA